jgi:2-polyprenyl-6-methoxyphenol hydroxylase-like FAD-dependent oxidoreductase
MVLIGDAAHATSPAAGQGASLAVEDAVILARCLRDLAVPEAFELFEATRRQRAQRIVAEGWKTSSAKSPNAAGRFARDLIMPVVMSRAVARGREPQAWMRQHHIDWDAPARTA